jgi:hypothetical protein
MPSIENRKSKIDNGSRTALAIGLALFVALQLAMELAIELWFPIIRDPFYGYKAERLRGRATGSAPRPFTVVMLGSSRTASALEAGILEKRLERELSRPVVAFNFGVPGSGPVTELLHLRRLLAGGVRPDLLLVEVLPPLLDGQLGHPREAQWLPAARLWHGELSALERFGFPSAELRRAWWQGWSVPWFTHRFAILSWVAPACQPYQLLEDWGRGDDKSGWAPRPPLTASPERALARARKEYATYLQSFRLGASACEALAEIIALCRREGIAPALVLMPEGPMFRSWYPPAVWSQIRNYLSRISSAFDVPLINAREWLAESAFADSHHLRSEGATAFTERLAREEIMPLVRRAGPGKWAAGSRREARVNERKASS